MSFDQDPDGSDGPDGPVGPGSRGARGLDVAGGPGQVRMPRSSAGPDEGDPTGAPRGSYDPVAVAAQARQRDPGLPADLAAALASEAGRVLAEAGDLEAPELARRLLARHREAGATPANVVAASAVRHWAADRR